MTWCRFCREQPIGFRCKAPGECAYTELPSRRFRRALLEGVTRRQVIALAALALLFLCVAGSIDYAAARVSELILLENSSQPASLGEAQRARPELGRPWGCISYQHWSDAPWHHRTCWWNE